MRTGWYRLYLEGGIQYSNPGFTGYRAGARSYDRLATRFRPASGKGPSIWDDAVHTKRVLIKDHSTGDIAADSYHNYRRDVAIMKELGLNFYRFSISWPRILPQGLAHHINKKGVEYYNNLIDELLANKIQPFVTMYHWDLPSNLQKLGGWANDAIIEWFSDYAKILLDKFCDRVKFWVTINEPKQICIEGYGYDIKAPFVNMSGIADYLCVRNVLLAHAKVFHMYDQNYRKLHNGSIGISLGHDWFEPASEAHDDEEAATDARQFYWGMYDNAIFAVGGDYPEEVKRNIASKSAEQGFPRSRLPELTAQDVSFIKGTADFLGVNYYTAKMAYRDASLEGMYPSPSFKDDMSAVLVKDSFWPQSASDWLQEVAWGLKKVLLSVKRQYDNPPVYITENGWSTSGGYLDDDRVKYIRNHLSAVLNAMEDGCDIRGYSVWSLFDNFEWLAGYSERFGLYEVDFSSDEKTRSPRKSAYVYKEIIRSKKFDPDYEPAELSSQ